MTKIQVTEDMIQIDADILSRAFEVDPQELKDRMRDGAITSKAEQGAAEDTGKVRLTFFSQDRRVRITADDQGNVLTCDKARIGPSWPTQDERRAMEVLLDEALAESFPASDPIAVSFDVPRRARSESGKRREE